MTTKKPAAFLALAGTAALVVAGPATLASPPTPADTRPDAGATASSLPVGDVDTALTSKSGQTTQDASAPTDDEVDPSALVTIVVQLGAELIEAVDLWRARQADQLSREDAVARLIENGLRVPEALDVIRHDVEAAYEALGEEPRG